MIYQSIHYTIAPNHSTYVGSSERGGTNPGVAYKITAMISGRAYSGYHKCSLFCSAWFLTVAVANASRTIKSSAITDKTYAPYSFPNDLLGDSYPFRARTEDNG